MLGNGAHFVLGWECDDSERLLGEMALLMLYASFFALMTRAFALLASTGFFGPRDGSTSA